MRAYKFLLLKFDLYVNIHGFSQRFQERGMGNNPFSAGKGFSPCNCPDKINFREYLGKKLDTRGKVWYIISVKQSKVKAFTCKVSSVTGQ